MNGIPKRIERQFRLRRCPRKSEIKVERGLLGLMTVCDQAADEIDREIDRTAVTRMLNLGDVFELVNNGLDDGTLAGQELVRQTHEFVLHVASGLGIELNARSSEQLQSEGLGDIASVSEELAKESLHQVQDWLSVIGVAWGEGDVEKFASFIDHQMELEAEEPIH